MTNLPENENKSEMHTEDAPDVITPVDGDSSDLTSSPEIRREKNANSRKSMMVNAEELNNTNLLAFLMSFFLGINDDKGMNSDDAINEMADALSIERTTFHDTVTQYKSGDLSIFGAATKVRSNMDISSADMARAEDVVAQHATTGNPLLELIASKESGGDYNIVYGGKRINATEMSINDVIAWQKNSTQNEGSASSAVGKYQIIRKTLTGLKEELGLSGKELLDGPMQERMAMALLERRGYDDYLAGDLPESDFMTNIAKEWASMPKDEGGLSYYAGDGLNKAHASPATLLLAMQYTKNNPTQSTNQLAFNNGGVREENSEQPTPANEAFNKNGGEGVDQVALIAAQQADAAAQNNTINPASTSQTLTS
ncbi:MAG: hypothetical protein COA45_01625 [Zetaproteobacteria bacterium]|nr:MAG: hypothetical protein COA45_01625 [Zetaproteobacteria bacterium]